MSKEISRRDFLKLLGFGAACGALGVIGGALGVKLTSSETQPRRLPGESERSSKREQKLAFDLPYFSVEGVPDKLIISSSDPRVANNGPDEAGNDHKNPFMPKSAAWLVTADPGHYRVDNLANVTDPNVRASIERDIRNGAAFAGDDYKVVLTGPEATIPLWEAGGAAVLTGAQMQIDLIDAEGNPITFQLGRQENHGWVVVIANGLDQDHRRGTDANRNAKLSKYDEGFTMWQGIPPGMFVSAQYVCQTIADAHGNYRDRGTSPGQGQDGVNNVSVLFVKILSEGVAYSLLQHNDPSISWDQYRPDQFRVIATNTYIK